MSAARKTPVEGTFTSATSSPAFSNAKEFNISLSGVSPNTVDLERSFNKGLNWYVVQSFTANTQKRVDDPEPGVWYRFTCSTYTSGTVTYRISGPVPV